ncbi:MAG: tRNA glutamyl-Q(34) synthetase GluQRS [Nevskia sp.]
MNGIETRGESSTGPKTGAYRGRFAPTPSGPLHLGSLLTALAGFLQARSAQGKWLLRIDDLDLQRSRVEHGDTILRQLEAHGLHWDEAVRRQSQHVEAYVAAIDDLARRAELYACICTRARLAAESLSGPDGAVYAGTCRDRGLHDLRGSLRLRVGVGRIALDDPWQGEFVRDLQRDIGDFVIRRADGQIGYQLACVVDEAALRITDVVRGFDLIGSSLRQLHLQDRLALRPPAYRHLPIVLDERGRKLSKQNHAAPLNDSAASRNLTTCLSLLGQQPPATLDTSPVDEILRWSISNWRDAVVPRISSLAAPV